MKFEKSHAKNTSVGFTPKTNSYLTTSGKQCLYCHDNHTLYNCTSFVHASDKQKQEFVRKHKLCFNCLRVNHKFQECRSSNCKKCGKRHNTLLHIESKPVKESSTAGNSVSARLVNNNNTIPAQASYCSFKNKQISQVMLSTAIVSVRDSSGNIHKCRALIDNGSQSHFVTERLVQKLKLRKDRHCVPIHGINNSTGETKYCVNIQLSSVVTDFTVNVNCLILPRITGNIPEVFLDTSTWNLPQDVQLADPTFNQPGEIELLLGAELFFRLLLPQQRTKPGNYPILQNTKLGWILAGNIPNQLQTSVTSCFAQTNDNLEQQLRKFWELEDVEVKLPTKEEQACVTHFCENTTRDSSGKFIVRLPFKEDAHELGDSHQLALIQLHQVERRLQRNPELREEYIKFLDEYESLGHMKRVCEESEKKRICYLPHHPVFKPSSSTTKTRIVFNASAKTTNDLSLNDILLKGPTIQQDIYSITLRFRTHEIALVADIEKMYRGIWVDQKDTGVQRILWRKSVSDPVQTFELQTVTYGTNCAPYLATACLQLLADLESQHYPNAAKVVHSDFYIDDFVSGCQNLQSALQLQRELISLLRSGGFTLRKWCSNHPALLEAVPSEMRELKDPFQFNAEEGIKALGLAWYPATDKLVIVNRILPNETSRQATKREVTRVIASIYDPLGLISPVVIAYKMFLQTLWLLNLPWDEILPDNIRQQWEQLCVQLPTISDIQINRLVLVKDHLKDVELHGFCDASQRAFGECLFVKSSNEAGETSVHLLCSKSRVAPVKKITLPRLELCGATLLAQLVKRTLKVIGLEFKRIHLWTDSKIVLAWISASPDRWKPFVANRVIQIQELTSKNMWNHVNTEQNPADLITRGVNPATLIHSELWWHGPVWLQNSSNFPEHTQMLQIDEIPEQRRTSVNTALVSVSTSSEFMKKNFNVKQINTCDCILSEILLQS